MSNKYLQTGDGSDSERHYENKDAFEPILESNMQPDDGRNIHSGDGRNTQAGDSRDSVGSSRRSRIVVPQILVTEIRISCNGNDFDERRKKISLPQTAIRYLQLGGEQYYEEPIKRQNSLPYRIRSRSIDDRNAKEVDESRLRKTSFPLRLYRSLSLRKSKDIDETRQRKVSSRSIYGKYLHVGDEIENRAKKKSLITERVIRRLKTGDKNDLRERRQQRMSLAQKMFKYLLNGEETAEPKNRLSFFDIVKRLPKKLFSSKDDTEDIDLSKMPRRFYHRRNAVQLIPIAGDYTIKNGSLKLWVDTVSPEEMEEFKEVFAIYDKDLDGAVHSKELAQILKNYGHNPTEDELDDMFLEADIDQSGLIEFPEFVTLMAKRRSDSAEDMLKAFEAFDENGDGKISADELSMFLSSTGEGLSEDLIAEIMQEADLDGDGFIDYEEFVEMMKID